MPLVSLFLSALPLLALGLTLWLSCPGKGSRRSAFDGIIHGALIWSGAVFLSANILSWFTILSSASIAGFWLLYILAAAVPALRGVAAPRIRLPRGRIYGLVYLLCGLTLLEALIYPPNNWDTLTYHLPRAMQWLQNHSLAPFFTNVPRQIGMPPFNSLVVLQILAGGTDRLVNLPQWLAYIGCICGACQIAADLGASPRARVCTALFAATIPGALMQASIPESTNIVSFWLLAFVWSFLRWKKHPDFRVGIQTGLCLGFAILSKGTSYPVALPFVLAIAGLCLWHWRRLLLQGLVMALLIVALNLPHLCRVWSASGNFVSGAEKNILATPGPATFVVNGLYNFLANESVLLSLGGKSFANALGTRLGISENDREIFPWGGLDGLPSQTSFNDGYGQNPFGALFLILLFLAIVSGSFRPPILYSSLLFFAFASYSFFLTWHPWTARLQLPLFMLAAPVCGIYLASWKRAGLRKLVALILGGYAILVTCLGDRPASSLFIPARNAAFHSRAELYIPYLPVRDSYLQAVAFLAAQRPGRLGIYGVDDNLEYPLWVLIRNKEGKIPEMIHLQSLAGSAAGPEYVWVQESGQGRPLASPRVFQKRGEAYAQVFP